LVARATAFERAGAQLIRRAGKRGANRPRPSGLAQSPITESSKNEAQVPLPFTVEGKLNSYGFAWLGGVGLRHGMDGLGETDPMVTGGIDLPLNDRLVLNFTINYMWQVAIDDLDGEFLVSINYGL